MVLEILLQERHRPPWFTSLGLYPLRRTTLLRVSLLAVIWGRTLRQEPYAAEISGKGRSCWLQRRCSPDGSVVKRKREKKFNRIEAKEQCGVSDIERLRVSCFTGCCFTFFFFSLPLLLSCQWPCQRALAVRGRIPSHICRSCNSSSMLSKSEGHRLGL